MCCLARYFNLCYQKKSTTEQVDRLIVSGSAILNTLAPQMVKVVKKTYRLLQVLEVEEDEVKGAFLKKTGDVYVWPKIEDISWFLRSQIVKKLENPDITFRGHYKFV